jgi:hypothetical protein
VLAEPVREVSGLFQRVLARRDRLDPGRRLGRLAVVVPAEEREPRDDAEDDGGEEYGDWDKAPRLKGVASGWLEQDRSSRGPVVAALELNGARGGLRSAVQLPEKLAGVRGALARVGRE